MTQPAHAVSVLAQSTVCRPCADGPRPRAAGKFLFAGKEKLWVRGVTYGTFHPRENGELFPTADIVEADFAQMAASGINAVRTYTVPPPWLLDLALKHRLWVMTGIPWEQHVTFLDDKNQTRSIRRRVAEGVRSCNHHPAVLCYVLGNEIPAPIVRWHGRERIERFVNDLYDLAKDEDPEGLFTYVSYPTTEYLELPFLDLASFNVYLESEERLEAYLGRLQNLVGDRPLLMGEVGLDSRRNGELTQASTLEWQIRTAFRCGCAGTFIFAWTDEWYRGGYDIEDWDFGLVTRDRRTKPALLSVSRAFNESPFPPANDWPKISVIVCSCNGAKTLGECCQALSRLNYPQFEIIVVNDGSTDKTEAIVSEHGFRVISTPRRGLSNARNTGMKAASGDIIAYIDDDAYPDRDWLYYLASTFLRTEHAGVGGPNIPPAGDGFIADCVSNAPGGPVHVLLSDTEAEHIPGCNMAFRKSALQEIGGFDAQFRTAGDDVDVCWRLQERGWTLGFNPAAVVWHHRRNSLRTYWKQQKGYGKAEALLEKKWPEKYSSAGHVSWGGRIYGKGLTQALGCVQRIYFGTWGSAPFQRLYPAAPGTFLGLPLMPEWYLLVAFLGTLTLLGFGWKPLLLAGPFCAFALGAPVAQAVVSGLRARSTGPHRTALGAAQLYAVTALLHLVQPLARLAGRIHWGLTPWRRTRNGNISLPRSKSWALWSEQWKSAEDWVQSLESRLCHSMLVQRGGDYDRWDLQLRGGVLGAIRLQVATEEHGAGKQLVRLRSWPRFSALALALFVLLATLSITAGFDHAWAVCGAMASMGAFLALSTCKELGAAAAALERAFAEWDPAGVPIQKVSVPKDRLPARLPTARETAIAGIGHNTKVDEDQIRIPINPGFPLWLRPALEKARPDSQRTGSARRATM